MNEKDKIMKTIVERKNTLIDTIKEEIPEILAEMIGDEFDNLRAELSCLIKDEYKNVEENTTQKTRINEDTNQEERNTRERLTILSFGNEYELKDLCAVESKNIGFPVVWRCDKHCEKHFGRNGTCSGCGIKKAINKLACYENAEERIKELEENMVNGLGVISLYEVLSIMRCEYTFKNKNTTIENNRVKCFKTQ